MASPGGGARRGRVGSICRVTHGSEQPHRSSGRCTTGKKPSRRVARSTCAQLSTARSTALAALLLETRWYYQPKRRRPCKHDLSESTVLGTAVAAVTPHTKLLYDATAVTQLTTATCVHTAQQDQTHKTMLDRTQSCSAQLLFGRGLVCSGACTATLSDARK